MNKHKPSFARSCLDYVIFIWRWVKNPRKVGSILPSSRSLADLMAKIVAVSHGKDAIIVELGAGTGVLTDGLIKSGIDPTKLCIVELDVKLCEMLHKKYPHSLVLQGDAKQLDQLLPKDKLGKVDAIISGLPVLNFSMKAKRNIIEASFKVLKPGGDFYQFTYGPRSPWPAEKLGLSAVRAGSTIRNLPPAAVWRYELKEK
jgi:phosphatidylethanolamine/phosphatidyl-N-methylethanolamine N-methyltransferase